MRTHQFVLFVTMVLSLYLPAAAQDQSQRRLEADIRFLADDMLQGRGTPSRGLDIAALYLANQLRASGWQPGNNGSYFQNYTIGSFLPSKATYRVSINNITLDRDEYLLMPFGMNPSETPLTHELVFAGYGVFVPERNVDNFAGVDLADKAVVSLLGAPWETDTSVVHAYDRMAGKMVHVTVRQGSLLIYVSEEFADSQATSPTAEVGVARAYAELPAPYLPEFQNRPTAGFTIPVLCITPEVYQRTLAEIVGISYNDWQASHGEHSDLIRPLGASMKLQVDVETTQSQVNNVVAMLPGTDPDLRDEWVVLTAHYDHLGAQEVSPSEDGIRNGADDNASGTAALLEITRRLAQGAPPRRSVLVLFTSGEEWGLLGSAHYSRHPLVPYDRIAVAINADMVGRSDGSVQGIVHGANELFDKAVQVGKSHGITVLPDQQPSWRKTYFTDTYNFAKFQVPTIEFFTGFHADYHQPSDEVQLIQFDELNRIVGAMYELTGYYAQGGEKPTFQTPAWFLTPE